MMVVKSPITVRKFVLSHSVFGKETFNVSERSRHSFIKSGFIPR